MTTENERDPLLLRYSQEVTVACHSLKQYLEYVAIRRKEGWIVGEIQIVGDKFVTTLKTEVI